ncbi:acyl carrier protein [Candidatus Cytomitobacter primus]|uniref:Acyl carrier protein n=1 Tax=Candidatus Cytomitobacter primus TaxID=2066024 RepID=A0A5C0UID1_9PROT|nr:acyl carrier protein [Candidatus Cytomitobacter primus]QEK38694.1 acyl carrier protein [Candidatus Cytomitobacter primus]
MNQSIKERVIKILKNFSKKEDVAFDDGTELKDLGLDSLDTVEMVMEVESEFSIQISDDAAAEFKTIGEIVNFITNAK